MNLPARTSPQTPTQTPSSLSLYVHIPFCSVRCTYCAFNLYTKAEALIPAYVQALCRELEWLGRATTQPVETIYFGGGAARLLGLPRAGRILDPSPAAFAVAKAAWLTVERTPRT